MKTFIGKIAGHSAQDAIKNAREVLEEDGFVVGRKIEVSHVGAYNDGRNTVQHYEFSAPVCFKGQE